MVQQINSRFSCFVLYCIVLNTDLDTDNKYGVKKIDLCGGILHSAGYRVRSIGYL